MLILTTINAGIFSYPNPNTNYNGVSYVWYNMRHTDIRSLHFKFERNDLSGDNWQNRGAVLAPYREHFYNDNGMGVRPVRIK